jgi:hypothetical protein
VLPIPAEYVGQVPLTVGSFVGIVPVESAAPLELPPLPLVVPPELPVEPLLLDALSVPPELPLRFAPPELEAVPPVLPLLPEVLDPLDPLELVPVFRPTPDPLLLPDEELALGMVVEVVVLPPELLVVSVESTEVGPVPPAAHAGADAATPRRRNMQRDSVPSNRFTEHSLREEVALRRT